MAQIAQTDTSVPLARSWRKVLMLLAISSHQHHQLHRKERRIPQPLIMNNIGALLAGPQPGPSPTAGCSLSLHLVPSPDTMFPGSHPPSNGVSWVWSLDFLPFLSLLVLLLITPSTAHYSSIIYTDHPQRYPQPHLSPKRIHR